MEDNGYKKFTRIQLLLIFIAAVILIAFAGITFLVNQVEAQPVAKSDGMYLAKVDRWIDGDSVIVDIYLGFDVWLVDQRARLARVDTPERGQPDFKEATELARKTCPDKVYITDGGRDKYGRLLVEMDCDGVRINDKLRERGWVY